jgi:purine nucleosidase
VVVVWTSAYPSHAPQSNRPSLNLVQDVVASRLLFDCGVPLVYLPGYHVGARLLISRPEMEAFVRGKGAIGDYLHDLYTHNPLHDMFALQDAARRTWVIWDMIVIAWLLNPSWVPTWLTPAPVLGDDLHWRRPEGRHLIREAYDVQRDEIFLDFYDKLKRAPA